MDKPKLRAAILIVSDTASEDPSTDKAGNVLSEVFASDGNNQWDLPTREIVPDDIFAIQRVVTTHCDAVPYVNLLITTGGTGFAVKDRTPEGTPNHDP